VNRTKAVQIVEVCKSTEAAEFDQKLDQTIHALFDDADSVLIVNPAPAVNELIERVGIHQSVQTHIKESDSIVLSEWIIYLYSNTGFPHFDLCTPAERVSIRKNNTKLCLG
jgi:uncharacterized lipoprotein YmbA